MKRRRCKGSEAALGEVVGSLDFGVVAPRPVERMATARKFNGSQNSGEVGWFA